MPEAMMRITSRPPGGAPPEIRDMWIGVVMPVEGDHNGPLADVMSHEVVDRRGAYFVNWTDAMEALGRVHPPAREWWEVNVSPKRLNFAKSCCEILPD